MSALDREQQASGHHGVGVRLFVQLATSDARTVATVTNSSDLPIIDDRYSNAQLLASDASLPCHIHSSNAIDALRSWRCSASCPS